MAKEILEAVGAIHTFSAQARLLDRQVLSDVLRLSPNQIRVFQRHEHIARRIQSHRARREGQAEACAFVAVAIREGPVTT
jgi:hypothetical protein